MLPSHATVSRTHPRQRNSAQLSSSQGRALSIKCSWNAYQDVHFDPIVSKSLLRLHEVSEVSQILVEEPSIFQRSIYCRNLVLRHNSDLYSRQNLSCHTLLGDVNALTSRYPNRGYTSSAGLPTSVSKNCFRR